MLAAIHHLLQKEWLKIRSYLGLVLTANLLVMAYIYVDLRHLFQIEHAEMLFYQANRIGRIFYSDMQFVPLLSGIAIAVAQYVPEVSKGRLRLSMHLPVGLTVLALTYVCIGLVVVGGIVALDLLLLYISVATFFPVEFSDSAVMTALPWAWSGVVAYLGTAMTMLEPRRVRQLFNLSVASGVVWLCLMPLPYGVYAYAFVGVVVLGLALIPASVLPMYRFRDGGA